jgi:TRAP-type uncharacterized transport system substrate-binding protein
VEEGIVRHSPPLIRSRLVLEVASELVGARGWRDRQVRVQFRPQGGDEWRFCIFGSDAANAVDAVATGEADVAIVNPGAVLAMARRGAGPFKAPVPVCALYVIAQFDQLAFAVTERTGLRSVKEIKERRYPLRMSLRGQPHHSIHLLVNLVLSELGFSLDDIVSWGGSIVSNERIPPLRLPAVERGEVDAIFDEAVSTFADQAFELGMRFLPVEEDALKRLEAMGIPRAVIGRNEYPQLAADVPTINFSGWPVFCLESLPDATVRAFCAALEARHERIPGWEQDHIDIAEGVQNTPAAPLTIPFHPAAEAYWRERGYL